MSSIAFRFASGPTRGRSSISNDFGRWPNSSASIRSDVDSLAEDGGDEQESFLNGLVVRQASPTVHGVAVFKDEWRRLGGVLEFGVTEEKWCFLVARHPAAPAEAIWPLTIYPAGTAEVVFQYMQHQAPFDSVAPRRGMFDRLLPVHGIELLPGRLE